MLEGIGRPRVRLLVDEEKCDLCRLCEELCPANAIEVRDRVVFRPDRCIACYGCVAICPHAALSLVVEVADATPLLQRCYGSSMNRFMQKKGRGGA